VHHRAWYGVAAVFVTAWLWQYASNPEAVAHLAGLDYRNYAEATYTWLGGGTWYLPRQLDGPYQVVPGDVLYPPTWLLLFVPAAIAPWPLWWVVPVGVTAAMLWWLRPAPLAWATIAAFLAWPPTAVHLLTGNPGIWLVAALALATRYRWPAAFLLTKVTVAPLALFGVRDRRWWYTAGALVLLSLPFAAMWPTYVRVLLDAQSAAGIFYSAQDLPMMMIPLVAWALRTRGRTPADQPRTNSRPSGPA
jgi:hypothetical protein